MEIKKLKKELKKLKTELELSENELEVEVKNNKESIGTNRLYGDMLSNTRDKVQNIVEAIDKNKLNILLVGSEMNELMKILGVKRIVYE